METWVVFQQDMALIKSIISDIIIVFRQTSSTKNLTCLYGLQHSSCIQDSHFSSVNESFGIRTHYFESKMHKENKYLG